MEQMSVLKWNSSVSEWNNWRGNCVRIEQYFMWELMGYLGLFMYLSCDLYMKFWNS